MEENIEFGFQITGKFNVKYDTTDHFWFECSNCLIKAKITNIERKNYDVMSTIYFYLKCPRCGKTAFKKVYKEQK